MITNEKILRSRQLAGRVTRWHTWPMIRKPTVMEHAGRVATLYVELWGMPRAEVLYFCLCHDYGELAAGDTPYGAKRRVPGLAENLNAAEEWGLGQLGITLPDLSEEEFKKFKVCDLLEMWETAVVEHNMGNQYAYPSIQSCLESVYKITGDLGESHTVTRWLDRQL